MGEYIDFQAHVQTFLKNAKEGNSKSSRQSSENEKCAQRFRGRRRFDSQVYQVRPCVCIAGFTCSAIQRVKSAIDCLSEDALPLESFHVTRLTDVKDGALLVPKVILVAVHCPGRKLIDSIGNEGQLDFLYDEVVEIGADILVVYLDLPRVIYAPTKDHIYHPRVAELLFPSQPRVDALSRCFGLITVVEGSDFNSRQRNLLRHWVTRPVSAGHRVYRTAENYHYLSEFSEPEWRRWSENDAGRRSRRRDCTDGKDGERGPYDDGGHGCASTNEGAEANRTTTRRPKKSRKNRVATRVDVELRRPLLLRHSGLEEGPTTVLELDLLSDEGIGYETQEIRTTETV